MKPNKRNSAWKQDAEFRIKNRWLRYSSMIAIRVKSALDEKNMTQADLAVSIGVTPQHIHKVIKGQENLTLESIYKLSQGLGVELITFPQFKHSIPFAERSIVPTRESFKHILIQRSVLSETTADLHEYIPVYTNDEILV